MSELIDNCDLDKYEKKAQEEVDGCTLAYTRMDELFVFYRGVNHILCLLSIGSAIWFGFNPCIYSALSFCFIQILMQISNTIVINRIKEQTRSDTVWIFIHIFKLFDEIKKNREGKNL